MLIFNTSALNKPYGVFLFVPIEESQINGPYNCHLNELLMIPEASGSIAWVLFPPSFKNLPESWYFPDGPMARIHTPSAGGWGSIFGQGIRFHMLQ